MQTSRAKVYPVNEVDFPKDIKYGNEDDFLYTKALSVIKPRYVEYTYSSMVDMVVT